MTLVGFRSRVGPT